MVRGPWGVDGEALPLESKVVGGWVDFRIAARPVLEVHVDQQTGGCRTCHATHRRSVVGRRASRFVTRPCRACH